MENLVLARNATRTPGAVYMVWYILTPCSCVCLFAQRAGGYRFSLRHSAERGSAVLGRGGCSAVISVSVQRIVLGFREQAVLIRCESIP